MSDWRMRKKCEDCPFASRGPGLRLRRLLRPGRWKEILNGLASGNYFPCHKTTDETGDGSNRVCAGSIEWQERHGYSSAYVRICQYQDMKRVAKSATKAAPFAS
jgi:hypothetical protein